MKRAYILLLVFVISSCGILQTNTPTPQPPTALPPITPNSLIHNPPYVHYSPREKLDIHLKFDYPESWIFYERNEYGSLFVSLADPRFLTLPPRDPNAPHSIVHDFASINIWVSALKPNETYNSIVTDYQEICTRESSWVEFINRYEIKIDTYEADVSECLREYEFDYNAIMFTKRIIFQVEHQIYVIDFQIAEYDRNNEFEQEYKKFLESIKITP